MDADELELWAQRKTPDGRNALYMRYADRIDRMIDSLIYRMGLPDYCDFESLVSAGRMGALEAIEAFDPARGLKFSTFALWRIRGAMLDELRRADIGRSVRRIVNQRLEAEQELGVELQREPTVEEVCEKLGWDTRQYLMSTRRAQSTLDAIKSRRSDTPFERPCTAIDLKETPAGRDAEAVFRELTRGLSIEEQTLVYLYYWCGCTMKLAGQAMGLSESRISQVHSALVKRLAQKGAEHFASAMSA